jgi:acyl-CoA thioester hydrolase
MQPLVSAEVEVRAPFHHVDALEIVWHGHYVEYFELARAALLDAIGYNYLEMRESGYAWPVIELFIRYARPVRYRQRVRVRAELVEWESRLKIRYTVSDACTGRRLTTGHSVQVAVRAATGEMCFASPDVLREKLSGFPAPHPRREPDGHAGDPTALSGTGSS